MAAEGLRLRKGPLKVQGEMRRAVVEVEVAGFVSAIVCQRSACQKTAPRLGQPSGEQVLLERISFQIYL